jgi:hypothetical protein
MGAWMVDELKFTHLAELWGQAGARYANGGSLVMRARFAQVGWRVFLYLFLSGHLGTVSISFGAPYRRVHLSTTLLSLTFNCRIRLLYRSLPRALAE